VLCKFNDALESMPANLNQIRGRNIYLLCVEQVSSYIFLTLTRVVDSMSCRAYSYTSNGSGALLLTKVVLGKVKYVSGWNEVMSCPSGYNSVCFPLFSSLHSEFNLSLYAKVVFDRQNGSLNETIIYSDDAIRPVFLIMF